MNGTGLATAIGAAVLYGGAPVAQASVVRAAPPACGLGFALLLQLLRRPVWLLALVGEIGGFLAEAYAFSVAPTMLVAPIASCDMLVFVVIGSVVFRRRPSLLGMLGVASTIGGVVALAFASEHDALGRPASTAMLIGLLVGGPIAVGVLAAAGQSTIAGRQADTDQAALAARRRSAAVAFSGGAGIAYAVGTLATRQIGRTFDPNAAERLLTEPAPYVLIVCSVLGIALLQRGLQAEALLTFPIISGLSAFLPVVFGIALLRDPLPAGGLRALLIVAVVLIALGLIMMARDRTTGAATDGVVFGLEGHR
jgi:hypothetical protein